MLKNKIEKSNIKSIAILSIISAFLMLLAFPPFNLFPFAFVALVPLNIVVFKAYKARDIYFAAACFVFVFFGILLFWIAAFMLKETDTTVALLTLFSILFLLVLLFYFPAMLLSNILSNRFPALRILIVPALFTMMEYMRNVGYIGFPWGMISYSQWNFLPFIQFADLTGQLGVSFFLYFVNAMIASFIIDYSEANKKNIHIRLKYILGFVISFTLIISYGFIQINLENKKREERDKTNIGLVQKAFDPNHKWRSIYTGEIAEKRSSGLQTIAKKFFLKPEKFNNLEKPDGKSQNGTIVSKRISKLVDELMAESKPDLIIHPESTILDSYGYYYNDNKKGLDNKNNRPGLYNTGIIYDMIRKSETYHLLGTSIIKESTNSKNYGNYNYYNGMEFIDTKGAPIANYGKIKLVPGGEAYPFDSDFWINMPIFGKVVQFIHAEFGSAGAGRWTVWDGYTIFSHPSEDYKFAAIICYESAFGNFTRRFIKDDAELLAIITEDAWSYSDNSQWQHFNMAVFRAVENRRDVVQNGNSGATGHISSAGKVLEVIPFWEPGFMVASMALNKEKTLYTLAGEWFTLLCLLFIVFLICYLIFLKVRNKTEYIKKNNNMRPFKDIIKSIVSLFTDFKSHKKVGFKKKKEYTSIFEDDPDSSSSSLSSIIEDSDSSINNKKSDDDK